MNTLAQTQQQELEAAVEAIIYATEEPATAAQIAAVLRLDTAQVQQVVDSLAARYAGEQHGVEVRAVAGGYRMATKPQHHEVVRRFVKSLKPPIRLSLPALETLAVIAYRQPVTSPEIKEIRGVDASGVLNTLLEKKLITTAGRKEVIGKPILYRTTRDFLVRFGLNGLSELPSLKEFEEMTRAGMEGVLLEGEEAEAPPAPETAAAPAVPAEDGAPDTP